MNGFALSLALNQRLLVNQKCPYCVWYWCNVMVNLNLIFGGLFCSIMELN